MTGHPDERAPGSLLHVETPPTIAVDAGLKWTGLCARVGSVPVDGACVGLYPNVVDDRELPHLDDFAVWREYYQRVYDMADAMWNRHFKAEPFVRVVVEEFTMPRAGNGRTIRHIPGPDCLVPREINSGVTARFEGEGTVGVVRDRFGQRHHMKHRKRPTGSTGVFEDYYHLDLRRKRPEGWMPNDHPLNVRDHERAAFDAAAAAELWVRERDRKRALDAEQRAA